MANAQRPGMKDQPPADTGLHWLREEPVNQGGGDPLPGGARVAGIRRWPGRRDIVVVYLDDNTRRGDLEAAFNRLRTKSEKES